MPSDRSFQTSPPRSICPPPGFPRFNGSLFCVFFISAIILLVLDSNHARGGVREEIRSALEDVKRAEEKAKTADKKLASVGKNTWFPAFKSFKEAERNWNEFLSKIRQKEEDLIRQSSRVNQKLEEAFEKKKKFSPRSRTYKRLDEEIQSLVREGGHIRDEKIQLIQHEEKKHLAMFNAFVNADSELSGAGIELHNAVKEKEKAFRRLALAREAVAGLRERAPERLKKEGPPYLARVEAIHTSEVYYQASWIAPKTAIDKKISLANGLLQETIKNRDSLLVEKRFAADDLFRMGYKLRDAEQGLHSVISSLFWYDLWVDFADKALDVLMDARTMGPYALIYNAGKELVGLGVSAVFPGKPSESMVDISEYTSWRQTQPSGDNNNSLGQAALDSTFDAFSQKGSGFVQSTVVKFVELASGADEITGVTVGNKKAWELYGFTLERVWSDGSKAWTVNPAFQSLSYSALKEGAIRNINNPDFWKGLTGFSLNGAVGFATGYLKKKNIDYYKKEAKDQIVQNHPAFLKYLSVRSTFKYTEMVNRYYAGQLDVKNAIITGLVAYLRELLDLREKKRHFREPEIAGKPVLEDSVSLRLTFSSEMDGVTVKAEGKPVAGSLTGKLWTGTLDSSLGNTVNLAINGVEKISRKPLDGEPRTIPRLVNVTEGGKASLVFEDYEKHDDKTHTLSFSSAQEEEGITVIIGVVR